MFIKSGKTGTVEELKQLLDSVLENEQVKSILILACDENGYMPRAIDGILKNVPVPVFGGTFPQIILGLDNFTKGCIVAGLTSEADVQIISGLSDETIDYEKILEEKLPWVEAKTMLVLVDGISTRISALIDSLFNVLGLEFNYIGGGAGSLAFKQKPCLLTNQGMIQDIAILVSLNVESGVGVSHGWTKVGGPFKVTESQGNIIHTLDWKPAFEVYKEVVENHSGEKFADHKFFDISKSYPFGINRLGAENIVRDPFIVKDDDSLVCVGDVPQEFYVHILTGDVNTLVNAAREAMEFGKKAYNGDMDKRTTLFFDCASRVMFLKGDFAYELKAVYCPQMPLIGALTIGEIANSRKEYLEFYNKTSVVGILED
ncbi:MAG: FIST N-terminal domain-containing protein [Phycisphaerae bacterium]|jgi:hypothetical protein